MCIGRLIFKYSELCVAEACGWGKQKREKHQAASPAVFLRKQAGFGIVNIFLIDCWDLVGFASVNV